MRWAWHILVIVIAVEALVVLLVLNSGIDPHEYTSYSEAHYQSLLYEPPWWERISSGGWAAILAIPVAGGTVGMWIVAIEALSQTKRSVDAHVDGARALLVHINTMIERPIDGTIRVHYVFRNNGNGVAIVRGLSMRHEYYDVHKGNVTKYPPPAKKFGGGTGTVVPVLLKPEELLSSASGYNVKFGSPWVIPVQQVDLIHSYKRAALIQFRIVYETQYGFFAKHSAFLYYHNFSYMLSERKYNVEDRNFSYPSTEVSLSDHLKNAWRRLKRNRV